MFIDYIGYLSNNPNIVSSFTKRPERGFPDKNCRTRNELELKKCC